MMKLYCVTFMSYTGFKLVENVGVENNKLLPFHGQNRLNRDSWLKDFKISLEGIELTN